jgi:hypothetical protein
VDPQCPDAPTLKNNSVFLLLKTLESNLATDDDKLCPLTKYEMQAGWAPSLKIRNHYQISYFWAVGQPDLGLLIFWASDING